MPGRIFTKYILPAAAFGLFLFAVYFVRGQNQTNRPTKPMAQPPQDEYQARAQFERFRRQVYQARGQVLEGERHASSAYRDRESGHAAPPVAA